MGANIPQDLAFGEMIRQGRAAQGWTIQELGARVERSKNQIYDMEKGRTCPVDQIELIKALAYTLELDLVSLYGAALETYHQWGLPSLLLEQVAERALAQAWPEASEPGVTSAQLQQAQVHGLQCAQGLFSRELEQADPVPIMVLYDSPGLFEHIKLLGRLERGSMMSKQAGQSPEGLVQRGDASTVTFELRSDLEQLARWGHPRGRVAVAQLLGYAGLMARWFGDAPAPSSWSCPLFITTHTLNQHTHWALSFLMPQPALLAYVRSLNAKPMTSFELAQGVAKRFEVSLCAARARLDQLNLN